MTTKAILQKVQSFDFLLACLLSITLCAIGYFIYHLNPQSHTEYSETLLEFSVADAMLTEDLFRLQSGDLADYDSVVNLTQQLRDAEHRLSHFPPHVEDSTKLNAAEAHLAVVMNDKLARIEDYKSTLATLRAILDNLPTLASSAMDSPENSQLPKDFIAGTLESLLLYLADAAPRRGEAIQARLTALDGYLKELPESDVPSTVHDFAAKATQVVKYRQTTTALLRSIAGVPAVENRPTPLNAALAHLSNAYHMEHQGRRLRNVVVMATIFSAMLILLLVLSYVTRWRSHQADLIIQEKQRALATALKEARTKSLSLHDGEAAEATRLAEERLASLVRNTFEYIAIISREENYIYLSPAIKNILGLSDSELIGKSVYEGIHADDIIRVKDYFTRAQKELQTEQTISYRVMDAYGKWHFVETFASNQHSNPAIRGMILNTRQLNDAPDS